MAKELIFTTLYLVIGDKMHFDLKEHTILLTVAGSRAYGMHTSESDVDIKGVAIPPLDTYWGVEKNFEQADTSSSLQVFYPELSPEEKSAVKDSKLEGSVYKLRKFISLASDCNPNILDALFCRDSEVRYCNQFGEILRNNRDLFLSARAKFTFSGYALSQLKRIETHRRWLLNPPSAIVLLVKNLICPKAF